MGTVISTKEGSLEPAPPVRLESARPGRRGANPRISAFDLLAATLKVGLLFAGLAGAILVVVFGGALLLGWGGTEWVGLLNVVGVAFILVTMTATLLIVAERKWSARMQNRIGPNRARLFKSQRGSFYGIPHLLADGLKMLFKEDFVPPAAARLLFNLAPVLAFAPVFALIAVVPVGPDVAAFDTEVRFQVARLDVGLLFVFAMASIAVFGTTLAGWAGNNNFGMLGALRAAAQMVSYEVTLALTIVGALILFQTLRLEEIALFQDRSMYGGLVPMWGIVFQPFALVLFLAAAFAEVKRAPFDLPEAESEIIGYFVEYSGMKFGLFMFAEFIEIVALSALITALFFGAWSIPWVSHGVLLEWLANDIGMGQDWAALVAAFSGLFVFITKMMFFVWLQMVIRWSFPRFRYDQLMDLGWKVMLPACLANVVVTAVAVVLDPSLNLAMMIGLVEMAVLMVLIVTAVAPRRGENRRGPRGDAASAREQYSLDASEGATDAGTDTQAA